MSTKFDIATAMNSIMASSTHQAIFAKPTPQFSKTAASKEDEKAKAEKEKEKERIAKEKEKAAKEKEKEKAKADKEKAKAKADKEKAKAKADKEKAKAKAAKEKAKKKAGLDISKFQSCVAGLAKISEVLDDGGLSKAASLALLALDSLVSHAQDCEPCDADDSDDKGACPTGVPLCNVDDGNDENNAYDEEEPTLDELLSDLDSDEGSADDEADAFDPHKWHRFLKELKHERVPSSADEFAAHLESIPDARVVMDPEEEDEFSLTEPLLEEPGTAVAGRRMTSLQKLALELRSNAAAKKKEKSKGTLCGKPHAKVKSGDHYPIGDAAHGRNALARVHQDASKNPSWWSGTGSELINAVERAVHSKFPGIGKDEKKKVSKAGSPIEALLRFADESLAGNYTANIKSEMSSFMDNVVGPTLLKKVTADMNDPKLAEDTEVHGTVSLRLGGSVNVATGAVTYLQGSGYEWNKDETISYSIGGQENPSKTQELKTLVINGWNKILQKYIGLARQNKISQFAFEYSGSKSV